MVRSRSSSKVRPETDPSSDEILPTKSNSSFCNVRDITCHVSGNFGYNKIIILEMYLVGILSNRAHIWNNYCGRSNENFKSSRSGCGRYCRRFTCTRHGRCVLFIRPSYYFRTGYCWSYSLSNWLRAPTNRHKFEI